MINTRPLPPSNVFRWAEPMVWNGELRNHQRALVGAMSAALITDEARANIRAAMQMIRDEKEAGNA